MSYKSREKKRRSRAAGPGETIATAAAKRNRNADTAGRWFLTLVRRTCSCARCGGVMREGRDMVYRHVPRECLCPACAEREGIKARPSTRWEEARKARR